MASIRNNHLEAGRCAVGTTIRPRATRWYILNFAVRDVHFWRKKIAWNLTRPPSWILFIVFLRKNFSNISKKSFICPFFNHWKKHFKIAYFQVCGTNSFVFFRKSIYLLFIAISKFKFNFFINLVEEVCPHPPHEFILLQF